MLDRIGEIINSNMTVTDPRLYDAISACVIDAITETYKHCASICREEVSSLDGQLCAEAILREIEGE